MGNLTIEDCLVEIRQPFREYYLKHKDWFDTARHPRHPGKQKERGGLRFHTIQVINKALEWNQSCDRRELIECCLVHDMPDCFDLPLTDAQRFAIRATKGAGYKEWRHCGHHVFVVLVLIADMWSAFINEKDLL